ncbi:hypothetical protein [Catellatospora sp. NPDC049609]|uniref:hypothetical protein n=1 Tax=Catellatospora sp. NPDC049609 TaxID=3155505 RepID=UPI00343F9434
MQGSITAPADLAGSPDLPASRSRLERLAQLMTTLSLALIAIKPFLDIVSEKSAANAVDLGVLLTVAGSGCMVVAFAIVAWDLRTVPGSLLVAIFGVAFVLLLSVFAYLATSGRADLLALFDVRRTSIYGGYIAPHSGIVNEAVRTFTGFAPLLLLPVLLRRPQWFAVGRLRLVTGVILAGAFVHSLIAWLQVAGVVPYSFFFQLPQGFIGRASGGYYHPMSLGRLLIFAVLLLYLMRDHLPLTAVKRYALMVLFVATGAVSLHRLTLVCLVIIVAAFEVPRLGLLVRAARSGAVSKRAVWYTLGGVLLVAGFAAWQWGPTIWSRVVITFTEIGSLDIRSDNFMHGRGAVWGDVADIFGQASADVWGFGFGYEPWDMHNDLVRVAVTWGVVGLLLVVAVFAGLYRFTSRFCDRAGRHALIVLYVTMFVFGLTQKPMSYPYFMWLFLFCHIVIIVISGNRAASGRVATGADNGERQ